MYVSVNYESRKHSKDLASLWSSFARTMSIDSAPEQPGDELGIEVYPKQTLAALSNSLILTLVCYNKFENEPNAYKLALESCQNSQGKLP